MSHYLIPEYEVCKHYKRHKNLANVTIGIFMNIDDVKGSQRMFG
jgi:hypothetical protein